MLLGFPLKPIELLNDDAKVRHAKTVSDSYGHLRSFTVTYGHLWSLTARRGPRRSAAPVSV